MGKFNIDDRVIVSKGGHSDRGRCGVVIDKERGSLIWTSENLKLITKGSKMKTPVNHYKSMIAYVEKMSIVEGSERPDRYSMERAIEESWIEQDCALCKAYRYAAKEWCSACPLKQAKQGCMDSGTHYGNMIKAPTWIEWRIHALKLLEVLEEIEAEAKEVTYRRGQRFKGASCGKFLLARKGNDFWFVCTDDGSMGAKMTSKNGDSITESEMGSELKNYILIEDK